MTIAFENFIQIHVWWKWNREQQIYSAITQQSDQRAADKL